MSEKPSAFDVLSKLANHGKKDSVFAFPLSTNFKCARTGKDGWGEITIAVSNHVVANIDHFVGSLYLADEDEYSRIEEELKGSSPCQK